jgi:hypothetical protein
MRFLERTRYARLVFLNLMGYAGHIMYSGASGRDMSTNYFSCSGGPGVVSIKCVLGHIMLNLCICILRDLRGT